MHNSKWMLGLLLVTSLNFPDEALSQDSSRTLVLFPGPQSAGTFKISTGFSVTLIPRAIAEESLLQLPLIDIRSRYWLTDNLFILGQANVVYLTNQVTLGIGWSYSFGSFSLAVSDEVGYWFGFADFQNFESTAMGISNFPSVAFGIEFEEIFVTFRTEALIPFGQRTTFGTSSVGRFGPKLAGFAFTLAVEEELWKNNYFLYGIRVQYSLPLYQTWVAFSSFNRWIVFPGFFIGYEL